MKTIHLFLLATIYLCAAQNCIAQNSYCQTDEARQAYFNSTPGAYEAWYQKHLAINAKIQELNLPVMPNNNYQPPTNNGIDNLGLNTNHWIIPVVFHVIHDLADAVGFGSNLPYEVIAASIPSLNEQFAGLAISGPNGSGIDSGIQFCLATDAWPFAGDDQLWFPANEPGVRRYGVNNNLQFWGNSSPTVEALNQIAGVGSDPTVFPSDRYLNVFVMENPGVPSAIGSLMNFQVASDADYQFCEFGGLRGITITQDAIGSEFFYPNWTYAPFQNLGRVLVHEVGHYFGLEHPFLCDGMTDGDCNTTQDFVCDTPPSSLDAFDGFMDMIVGQNMNPCPCQSGPFLDANNNQINSWDNFPMDNGCVENITYALLPWPLSAQHVQATSPTDYFDLAENHMDYTENEACRFLFTWGQVARMQASISEEFPDISSEMNLALTGVASSCMAPYLLADFLIATFDHCVSSPISFFTPHGDGLTAINWQWDFGDGSPIINGPEPIHTYLNQGVFTITLTAFDNNGGFESCSHDITITNCTQSVSACNPIINSGFELNFATLVPAPPIGSGTAGCFYNTCVEGNSPLPGWQSNQFGHIIERFYSPINWGFFPNLFQTSVNMQNNWNNDLWRNHHFLRLSSGRFDIDGDGLPDDFKAGVSQQFAQPLVPNDQYILECQFAYTTNLNLVDPPSFAAKNLQVHLDEAGSLCSNLDPLGNFNPIAGTHDASFAVAGFMPDQWHHIIQPVTTQVGSNLQVLSFSDDEAIASTINHTFDYFLDDVCIAPQSANPISATAAIQPGNTQMVVICSNAPVDVQFDITLDFAGQNSDEVILELVFLANYDEDGDDLDSFDDLVPQDFGELLSQGTTFDALNQFHITPGMLNGNTLQLTETFAFAGADNPGIQYVVELRVAANSPSGCLCHSPFVIIVPAVQISETNVDLCDNGIIDIFVLPNDPINITYSWTALADINFSANTQDLYGPPILDGLGNPVLDFFGNPTFIPIPNDTYTVVVTNNVTGCTATASYTVSVITDNPQITNVVCPGADTGIIDPQLNPANANYIYEWTSLNTLATTTTLQGAGAATYQLEVTIPNVNCFFNETYNINQPPIWDVEIVHQANSCNGVCVVANVSGATPPYLSTTWSLPNGGAVISPNNTLCGQAFGTYTFTVTDFNACIYTEDYTFGALTVVAQAQINETCAGAGNGQLAVTGSGGLSPYTYQWSNGPTTQWNLDLVSGTYTVTVTDDIGCTVVDSYTIITQPIVLTPIITHLCNGGNGQIVVDIANATYPVDITWNLPLTDTDNTVVITQPGTYTINVLDDNLCPATGTYTVNQSATIAITADVDAVCDANNLGEIDLTTTGGTGPFIYDWTPNPLGATLDPVEGDYTNLPLGSYFLTATDANGCVFNDSYWVEPSDLQISNPFFTPGLCRGGFDGSYHITVMGGSTPYSYQGTVDGGAPFLYNPGSFGEVLPQVNFFGAGLCETATQSVWNLLLTDADGCSATTSVVINVPDVAPAMVTSATSTNITCFGDNNGNGTGTATSWTAQGGSYNYQWFDGTLNFNSCTGGLIGTLPPPIATTATAANLPPGDYTVITYNNTHLNGNGVQDWAQCYTHDYITISEPLPASIIEIDTKEIGCHTTSQGLVNVDVQDEGAGATYIWSNGTNTFIGEDLITDIGGNWQLTVSYGNGCEVESNVYALTSLANNTFDSDGNLTDAVVTIYSTTLDPPVGSVLHFTKDIEIRNNTVWAMDNCIVRMAPGKKIVVMTNGSQDCELHAENYTVFDRLCETNWQSIEVLGTTLGNQYRSELYLTDCEIKHANIGLQNHSGSAKGGYIGCTRVLFEDNTADVWLKDYFPTSAFDANDILTQGALFDDCTFSTTSAFAYANTNARIKMENIGQVGIFGCTFTNGNLDLLDTQPATCISSTKSSFWLNGCGYTDDTECDGQIEGFSHGVSATSELADFDTNTSGNDDLVPFTGVDIRNMTFNTYRAFTANSSIDEITIADNAFLDLNLDFAYQNPPFGFTQNTDGSAAYAVSITGEGSAINIVDNEIDFHLGYYRKGIIVDNLLGHTNYIYRNSLSNLTTGLLLRKQNRTTSGAQQGLHIECNTFTNAVGVTPSNDIVIDGAQTPYANNGVFTPQNGSIQGVNLSAGNNFENSEDPNSANTGDNVSKNATQVTTTMEYWWHDDDFGTADLNAADDFVNMLAGFAQQKTLNDCTNPFDLVEIPEALMMMENSMAAYNEAKGEWTALVDGGDTEALTEEVIYSTFAEALELYYEMMSKSPNLSEEVMMEAINKEYELPAVLLTQILESNPTAAKSGKVQEKLDERMLPLDEYQRAQIMQGLQWVSQKEALEYDMGWQRLQRSRAQQSLAKQYRADAAMENKLDAILSLYDENLFIEERYQKARLLRRHGRSAEAIVLLQGADEVFKMDEYEITERDELLESWAMELEIVSASQEQLTETQRNYLEGVYYGSSNRASQHALGLLLSYSDFEWYPDIAEGVIEPRSYQLERPVVENNFIAVYPNPANSFVIVEIKEALPELTTVKMWDGLGRLLLEQKVAAQQRQFILQLNVIEAGNYFITLNNANGEMLEIVPFIKE